MIVAMRIRLSKLINLGCEERKLALPSLTNVKSVR